MGNGHHVENGKKRKSSQKNPSKPKKPRILVSLSPNKKIPQLPPMSAPLNEELNGVQSNENDNQDSDALLNRSLPLPNEICDVCNSVGTSQNLVK